MLAALALRVVVPAGCMPADPGSGWFLQICPQGLSPAAMAVLHPGHVDRPAREHTAAADAHAHHAHHHGHEPAANGGMDHGAGRGHDDGAPNYEANSHCPVGSVFSAAAIAVDAAEPPAPASQAPRFIGATPSPLSAPRHPAFHARAPPLA